jgi:hypothetical protein
MKQPDPLLLPQPESYRRNRLHYLLVALAVVPIGLASRSPGAIYLPRFVAMYAGDTLWALLVFLVAGMLAPASSTSRVATAVLLFAVAIEVSQLYHAPWIDAIRNTGPGGLVLGFSFLWSDLACYGCGIAFGAIAELLARRIWPPPIRHERQLSE